MNAAELIAELQKLDPNLLVSMRTPAGQLISIDEVSVDGDSFETRIEIS